MKEWWEEDGCWKHFHRAINQRLVKGKETTIESSRKVTVYWVRPTGYKGKVPCLQERTKACRHFKRARETVLVQNLAAGTGDAEAADRQNHCHPTKAKLKMRVPTLGLHCREATAMLTHFWGRVGQWQHVCGWWVGWQVRYPLQPGHICIWVISRSTGLWSDRKDHSLFNLYILNN